MTINGAIDLLDGQKPNGYPEENKRAWLDKLDRMVFREVIETHEGGPESFDGYDALTDGDTELLIPDEFRDVYLYWLYAMVDFANQEMQRYGNSMLMFNNSYLEFTSWWNRTHMPVQKRIVGARGYASREPARGGKASFAGTTPSYTLEIEGYDLTDMSVYLTIIGASGAMVSRTNGDLVISGDETGSVIAFRLTQAETMALGPGTAQVQVRFIDGDGKALATDIGEIRIDRTLQPGVIEYREA